MKTENLCYLLLLFIISILSCEENYNTEEGGMSRFISDSTFVNRHEIPDSIAEVERGEWVEIDIEGGEPGRAYVFRDSTESNRHLFVFHEWWGLNNHIQWEAQRLYDSLDNVTVWAIDMYDGRLTNDPDSAGMLTQLVAEDRGVAIINGVLKEIGDGAEVATIGWCFGGSWSLKAAIEAGETCEACVIYYGMPVDDAERLKKMEAPVLGIFAEEDNWITATVIEKFQVTMEALDKDFTYRVYPAEHAFANPSSPRFEESAAVDANKLALQFIRNHF